MKNTKTTKNNPFKILKKHIINIITIIPRYILTGFKYIFEKKNKDQKDVLNNKFIGIIIATLSIVTYLLCVFIISRWYVQNERTKKFADSLINDPIANQDLRTDEVKENTDYSSINEKNGQIAQNYMRVNLDYYIIINKETVAWLQVNGTNINYPVVQHKDNSYYLTHDFYQHKTNVGWVFGDYRDDFKNFNNNTIIYAHNLVNRTMFGQIPYLMKSNWFSKESREYIKLSTKNTNSIWQIFSVYETDPTTDYLQAIFYSPTTYQVFLDNIKKKSKHKFKTTVTNTDKILTLSTCNDIGNKRVAVHAKLVKIENK